LGDNRQSLVKDGNFAHPQLITLATEFDAFGFRIGPAPCCALGDAAAFEFRGNAERTARGTEAA
jgi:hypothetical protein